MTNTATAELPAAARAPTRNAKRRQFEIECAFIGLDVMSAREVEHRSRAGRRRQRAVHIKPQRLGVNSSIEPKRREQARFFKRANGTNGERDRTIGREPLIAQQDVALDSGKCEIGARQVGTTLPNADSAVPKPLRIAGQRHGKILDSRPKTACCQIDANRIDL